MRISAKELRSRTREALETVARGETVTITYRGAPRARLVPIDEDDGAEGRVVESDANRGALFGLWRDRTDMGDPREHVDRSRARRY